MKASYQKMYKNSVLLSQELNKEDKLIKNNLTSVVLVREIGDSVIKVLDKNDFNNFMKHSIKEREFSEQNQETYKYPLDFKRAFDQNGLQSIEPQNYLSDGYFGHYISETPEIEPKTSAFTNSWTYYVVREYLKQGSSTDKGLENLKKDILLGVDKMLSHEKMIVQMTNEILDKIDKINKDSLAGKNIEEPAKELKEAFLCVNWEVEVNVAEKLVNKDINIDLLKEILPKKMLSKYNDEVSLAKIQKPLSINNNLVKKEKDLDLNI